MVQRKNHEHVVAALEDWFDVLKTNNEWTVQNDPNRGYFVTNWNINNEKEGNGLFFEDAVEADKWCSLLNTLRGSLLDYMNDNERWIEEASKLHITQEDHNGKSI